MGVNSLPKTVTRRRRGCDLNPGPSAPESSTLTTRRPSHGRSKLGHVAMCSTRWGVLLPLRRGLSVRRDPKEEMQKWERERVQKDLGSSNDLVLPVVLWVVTKWSKVNTTTTAGALMRDATKCRLRHPAAELSRHQPMWTLSRLENISTSLQFFQK